jgi:hypothetical protein
LKLTQLRSQARIAHGTQRGKVERIRTGSRKRQTCVAAPVRHIPKAHGQLRIIAAIAAKPGLSGLIEMK